MCELLAQCRAHSKLSTCRYNLPALCQMTSDESVKLSKCLFLTCEQMLTHSLGLLSGSCGTQRPTQKDELKRVKKGQLTDGTT